MSWPWLEIYELFSPIINDMIENCQKKKEERRQNRIIHTDMPFLGPVNQNSDDKHTYVRDAFPEQQEDEKLYLTNEEQEDLNFYKTLTPEAARQIIRERKEKAEKEEAEKAIQEQIQIKVKRQEEKEQRWHDEVTYLSSAERIALSEEEKQFLIQKRKQEEVFQKGQQEKIFQEICNSLLFVDTCFWEKANEQKYSSFFTSLLAYCKKNTFKVTLLSDVYHEVINHANEETEKDEKIKEEIRFRGRSAKKEIERFQKENCLLFPDENQIHRNSKIVSAYADDQICREIQKQVDEGISCTLLTDDRDLRLRVRGIIQGLPEDRQKKYKCLSIEDILEDFSKQ